MASLSLLAGPLALRLLRERGLRFADVDVVVGASGGPKWLALAGLDRYLAGTLFAGPRARPLPLVGSSIGAWRLACWAQRDPVAALARGHHAYIEEQSYTRHPSTREITEVSARILDRLLGPTGVDEILGHPFARLQVLATGCRGLVASEHPLALRAGLGLAVAGNLVSRRTLGWQMYRAWLHTGAAPAVPNDGIPTVLAPLGRDNLRAALLASGSIPLVLDGARVPGLPGLFRDGGLVDYHPVLDHGPGEGLVLYPHFYPHLVPGWLDKALPWRRARGALLDRVLLIAPSADFVRSLPFGRIPDRRDFYRIPEPVRVRVWNEVVARTQVLGDELGELVERGRIDERVKPLAP